MASITSGRLPGDVHCRTDRTGVRKELVFLPLRGWDTAPECPGTTEEEAPDKFNFTTSLEPPSGEETKEEHCVMS